MAKTFTRRGRLEIINDILSICQTPVHKTRILYKCNLSYDQIQKYISFLIHNELLTVFEEDGRELYQITKRGKKFIGEHKHLSRLLYET